MINTAPELAVGSGAAWRACSGSSPWLPSATNLDANFDTIVFSSQLDGDPGAGQDELRARVIFVDSRDYACTGYSNPATS